MRHPAASRALLKLRGAGDSEASERFAREIPQDSRDLSARLAIPTNGHDDWGMNAYWYYTLAVLLVLLNICALATNVLTLPGNWFIVALTVLFAVFIHLPSGAGISLGSAAVVVGLALLGELIEFAAGAAGAAKSGGSRRGMILSVLGAMVGSIAGAMLGVLIPVPLVGPLIGAVAGGAIGAFAGAYAGESWKGRSEDERMAVSMAAMAGRVLGTVGKLGIGAVMVVVTAVAVFVN